MGFLDWILNSMVRKLGQESRDRAIQLVVVKVEQADFRSKGPFCGAFYSHFLENIYIRAPEKNDSKHRNKNRP